MIQAKVVADSKNEFGNRITTMVVTMPRIILAEFNTHRMFSRNSASSRAIPFEKMVKAVQENPFIPIAWQKDHKGMQGTEYLLEGQSGHEGDFATLNWMRAIDNAIAQAQELHKRDVTKQLCNRLLEPFMWHTVICTATDFENFFTLRCPKYETKDGVFRSQVDAITASVISDNDLASKYQSWSQLDWLKLNKGQSEIHMMALAEAMWDAYNESTPKELKAGEWHIPFGDNINDGKLAESHSPGEALVYKGVTLNDLRIKIATARCARVSYTVVGEEGKPDNYENDIKLHDRLAASGHWSPFEHCARAMGADDYPLSFGKQQLPMSGNFRGFIQYRKMVE